MQHFYISSNSEHYTQLIQRYDERVEQKYELQWTEEGFDIYLPHGDDYCVGVRTPES